MARILRLEFLGFLTRFAKEPQPPPATFLTPRRVEEGKRSKHILYSSCVIGTKVNCLHTLPLAFIPQK